MIEGIRKRLTLGYVGIFALILTILGAVVLASFAGRVAAQQDELLEQKALGTRDYVQSRLLDPPDRDERKPEEPPPGERPPRGEHHGDRERGDGPPSPPIGPIRASVDPDVGVAAVAPRGTVRAGPSRRARPPPRSASRSRVRQRRRRARGRREGRRSRAPGREDARGERPRNRPQGRRGGRRAGRAVAREVWESVRDLAFVLVPAGVGGLLLAGAGGLYLSRRAMQPVEDSFERQRTFVADASHELKTPLALVKVNAEMMRRNPGAPENGEVLEDQLSEIDRMNALLSDLLTLARLDAQRLEVDHKPFDLAVVAAEAAGRFLKRAAIEGVRLEVDVPDLLPACGDPERTGQILAALIDNAVRHTPEGGVITISGRETDGRAEASVEDTGPGIPPEHMGRIFDRFYRAEEARTRAGGGTGLGLSIARDLARAQGGDLSAGNLPRGDGGAVFRLRLPTR
ncbi:hypothetical protein GBA65_06385 [Rubrobacter marinus]|uniref:histidine kinase n=1 Tax=Rubrobacter marinus TaxID=2653852 RepID=A0A6G8PVG4_9ACTN|nr:HAMP domain-containing sensor histidine kinase [Rubrobacter marinus]QIN78201.1 hypothetical protein GBA65_06385 [Rubrobacter marinus]